MRTLGPIVEVSARLAPLQIAQFTHRRGVRPEPSVTMASASPCRFTAFFMNRKAADLSRFLVKELSRISPS